MCSFWALCIFCDCYCAKQSNFRNNRKIPPAHEPGLYPRWVASFGVTDVIAGGMGQKAIDFFNQQNINVFVGAPVKGEKEIIENFWPESFYSMQITAIMMIIIIVAIEK